MIRLDKKVRELAAYGLGSIANSALGLVLLPLYMKAFPPGDYGVINVFLLIVTFASMFVSAGMMSALHRQYFVVPEQERKKLIGTTLAWYSMTVALISAVIVPLRNPLSVLFFQSGEYRLDFILILVIVWLTLVLDVPLNVLRLERKATIYVTFSLLRLVSELSLKIVFIVVLRSGIHGYFVSSILSLAITNLGILLYTRRSMSFSFSRTHVKMLLKLGVPFIFSGFSIWSLNALGRFQLNFMIGQSSTGIYSAGQRFSQLFNVAFYKPISLLLPPVMLSGSNEDDRVWRRFSRLMSALNVAGGLIAALISILSVEILKMITAAGAHADYRYATQVIPALTFSNLAYALTIPIGYLALRIIKTNILAYTGIIAAVSNFAFNYLLIRLMGYSGVAWASLASFIEYALFSFWLVGRHKKVGFHYGRELVQFGVALIVTVLLQYVSIGPALVSLLVKLIICTAVIIGTAWRITRLVDVRMVGSIKKLIKRREVAKS